MAQTRILPLPLALLVMIPLSPAPAADLHQELTRLLDTPCLKKGEVGLRVADVAGEKILFDSGGEKLLGKIVSRQRTWCLSWKPR